MLKNKENREITNKMSTSRPKWHLGFDCATKTFAFSLSCIDLEGLLSRKNVILTQLQALREIIRRATEQNTVSILQKTINDITPIIAALDLESKSFIKLLDGETIDLFPNRADSDISMVERLREVSRYVSSRIRPKLNNIVPKEERLRVVIEFQMGPNAKARAVAAALITIFAEEDVIIVGPTLKNKVFLSEEGRYCYFAEKYKNSYCANKAHAKYNFALVEELFGTKIPLTTPASLRGHIADSFMQVLGYLIYGPDEKDISLCF
jgi:hypothetical protein